MKVISIPHCTVFHKKNNKLDSVEMFVKVIFLDSDGTEHTALFTKEEIEKAVLRNEKRSVKDG